MLADASALAQLVRGELVRRLVLGDARAKAFDRDPAALAELDRMRDEARRRLWIEKQSQPPTGYPPDEDVRRAYDAARDKLAGAAEYRLSQIFLSAAVGAPPGQIAAALRKAGEIEGKLPRGDFAALARQYSEHADSAAKGGDLGLLPEARLLPEVRAALATLKVGEVAGPIKTAQGLHFVKLTERQPVAVPPLGEVREALVTALRQQRAGELQQAYLSGIGGKSPPSVNEVELGRLRPTLR